MDIEDVARLLPLFALGVALKYWFFTPNIPMAIVSVVVLFITCVISGVYNG